MLEARERIGGRVYTARAGDDARVDMGAMVVTGVPGKVAGSRWIGGQLSSWNRVCFQGGYLEVRYKSPGTFGEDGLWPAIWTLGNLARCRSLPALHWLSVHGNHCGDEGVRSVR